MKVDYTSHTIDVAGYSSVIVAFGNEAGDKMSFTFYIQKVFPWSLFNLESEVNVAKYTKELHKLAGWAKLKAMTKCALFGHNENFAIVVPIFLGDKWHELKGKINHCSRCQWDFKMMTEKGD